MEKEYIIKNLLETVYLTLQQFGYSNVSLKKQDLLEYIPKIEKILEKNKLMDSDLFIKTPVEETYDEFKWFLITVLIRKNFGHFNEKYDTIILNYPDFYIYRCQELLKEYKDIIFSCCFAITSDIKFADDDLAFETLSLKDRYKRTSIINCTSDDEFSEEKKLTKSMQPLI